MALVLSGEKDRCQLTKDDYVYDPDSGSWRQVYLVNPAPDTERPVKNSTLWDFVVITFRTPVNLASASIRSKCLPGRRRVQVAKEFFD